MPRLSTNLVTAVEPTEGQTYTIVDVEQLKTIRQGFNGVRVRLEPEKRRKEDEANYASMLWTREEAGAKSKIGSFIAGFRDFFGDEDKAQDTDNWKGHKVRFDKWREANRAITVVA